MGIEGSDLIKIIIAIASITYSVIFGILAKKLFDVPKTVQQYLDDFDKRVEARLQRVDEESKLAHRRLNVQDRITSKLAGKDFDSRAVAESGLFPDVRTTVRHHDEQR